MSWLPWAPRLGSARYPRSLPLEIPPTWSPNLTTHLFLVPRAQSLLGGRIECLFKTRYINLKENCSLTPSFLRETSLPPRTGISSLKAGINLGWAVCDRVWTPRNAEPNIAAEQIRPRSPSTRHDFVRSEFCPA